MGQVEVVSFKVGGPQP